MSGSADGAHRTANRFRAGVHVTLGGDEQTLECEAENISRTGVLLVGPIPEPSAELVNFTIHAPSGSLKIRLAGRVIRIEPDGNGGRRVALEFVDLDEGRRGDLEALVARLLNTPAGGPFDHLKPGAPPLEIKKALEAIPLPKRIALAARAAPKERDVLRLDTHPAVLESLAKNPGLALVEARALAASTHATPGVLEGLLIDLRFKDDEELRMTVAVHPRAPLSLTEKATQPFKAPQIRKLLAKPGLNQILREKLIRRSSDR